MIRFFKSMYKYLWLAVVIKVIDLVIGLLNRIDVEDEDELNEVIDVIDDLQDTKIDLETLRVVYRRNLSVLRT